MNFYVFNSSRALIKYTHIRRVCNFITWAAVATSCVNAQFATNRTPTQDSVSFGEADGQTLTMDYYAPDGDGPHPAVVILHGGGWVAGDSKGGGEVYCAGFLAPAGYAVFSINYRLAPKYPYPAMVLDVERSIRFIRHHASRWNLDPEKIALLGGSAGGYLSNMVGLLQASGIPTASDLVDRESAKVQGVISLFAPTSFETMKLSKHGHQLLDPLIKAKGLSTALREASPIRYVSADSPPFLQIIGDKDEFFSLSDVNALDAALRGNGRSSSLIIIPDGRHGINDWHTLPRVPDWERQLVNWLNKQLAHTGPVGEGIQTRSPQPLSGASSK